MSRLVRVAAGAGLVLLSAWLGFQLHHYQQERRAPGAAPDARSVPAVAPGAAEIIGRRRPEFTLPDLDGRPRSIDEWDGKVIALNFWATWCPPCLEEVPAFVRLQKKYQARGLQFVGIALQRPEEVRPFAAEHGMNYPVLAGELEVIEAAEAYGNRLGALPYTVFINRDGRVAAARAGALSTEQAEAIIARLL